MNGFALLWGKILDSSLWRQESKETRLVWITMLAMKNSEGKLWSSVVGLADRAKVTLEECKEALAILSSPDAEDTSGVDEGRRIRQIQGGWEIVNHDMYRFSTEAKREFWRQQKAEQRAAEAAKKARRKGRRNTGDDGKPASHAYKARERAAVAEYERSGTGEAAPLNAG